MNNEQAKMIVATLFVMLCVTNAAAQPRMQSEPQLFYRSLVLKVSAKGKCLAACGTNYDNCAAKVAFDSSAQGGYKIEAEPGYEKCSNKLTTCKQRC